MKQQETHPVEKNIEVCHAFQAKQVDFYGTFIPLILFCTSLALLFPVLGRVQGVWSQLGAAKVGPILSSFLFLTGVS